MFTENEVSQLCLAISLMIPIVPNMELDTTNPLSMAEQVVAEVDRLRQSEERAWCLIANAFEGNWGKAPSEWGEAAERWRDEYHKHLQPVSVNAEKPL